MGTIPRYLRKRLVETLPLWWQPNAENEWGLHPTAEWRDLRKDIISFIHEWGVNGVVKLSTSSVRFEIRPDMVVKKFGQYSGEMLSYYLERFADHKPVGDFRIYGVETYPGMKLCADMYETWPGPYPGTKLYTYMDETCLEKEGGADLPFVIKAMNDLLWTGGDKYE